MNFKRFQKELNKNGFYIKETNRYYEIFTKLDNLLVARVEKERQYLFYLNEQYFKDVDNEFIYDILPIFYKFSQTPIPFR